MSSAEPWFVRAKRGVVKFWRTEDSRVATARDILVAAGIVFLLLGAVWLYTGQRLTQSPIVVVESGSLMHGRCQSGIYENCFRSTFDNSPFGRVGTVDPGDLVMVKRVDSLEDVEPAFGAGDRSGYGGDGDVIVYKSGGAKRGIQIIHRAMLLIQVEPENCIANAPQNPCRFIIASTCDPVKFAEFTQDANWEKYCVGSTDPITLNLRRGGLSLNLVNYPCAATTTCGPIRSGFITKGDNNAGMDQPGGGQLGGPLTTGLVELSWVVGKARGEIPWFGMIKLALFGNSNYHCRDRQPCSDPNGPPQPSQWTILRATAPWDVWVSFLGSLALLITMPMIADWGWNKWRGRRRGL